MHDHRGVDEAADRVLMLAPTARDAEMARGILGESGFTPYVLRAHDDLTRAIEEGAGVVILMEEYFATEESDRLLEVLGRQPAWSSLPIIVLTSGKGHLSRAEAVLKTLANVVLLDRPTRIVPLLSAIRAALAARRRQYELRDSIEEMKRTAEERDRLYREANAARAEAEAADGRKNEFLAMLAHELRNPLSAVNNAVTLAARSGLHEHVEWSRDVITRQMRHLTRLIDDLMDVSRINRGKIELRRELLDLTGILDSALMTVRPLIEEREHRLEVDMDRGRLWADADPTRLEQVVVNLLNNAAKYSEKGGHIRVSAANDGGGVVIAIADRGVGIPPEKLPQMFELFAQGDRSLARSEGGLGIGLTVVKQLVELHGGTIEATSEVGNGSEFTIRLPHVAVPPAEPSSNDLGVIAGHGRRVLIVDDNADVAGLMGEILTMMGFAVDIVHDGRASIGKARERRPEVVLLDIGLPGMDGFEVARQLRLEEWCRDTVIVGISGYGDSAAREQGREAGFNHHLVKPVDIGLLLPLLG
ncbi:hybrid sensor histidine kinase/response regulator [Singulisphaera sp. PoT]|uniref:hybrid sensor histidine kinase/response regulator n=1 Tax=Singulisphaera sp. PoT TaxID=3411797 RepID=UPI003BF46C3F